MHVKCNAALQASQLSAAHLCQADDNLRRLEKTSFKMQAAHSKTATKRQANKLDGATSTQT
jgi:hypothetical protein